MKIKIKTQEKIGEENDQNRVYTYEIVKEQILLIKKS